MFRFLTRQHFIVNLLAAIALVFLIIFCFLWSLGFITHHGEYEKVPSVLGKTYEQAKDLLENKGFKVEVQDSLYYDSLPPLAVIKQSPEGEMMVKSNRLIYLIVNRSSPPLVEVPNMVGYTFRNAEMYLKQMGLKLGDTTRRFDIAKDAVLEQLYNGRTVTPGTKIFIGSTISFVLGSGLGDEQFDVPNLIGLSYEEAKTALLAMNLNISATIFQPGTDSLHGFIYEQRPMPKDEPNINGYRPSNKIRAGQGVDLFLRKEPLSPDQVDSIANPRTVPRRTDDYENK